MARGGEYGLAQAAQHLITELCRLRCVVRASEGFEGSDVADAHGSNGGGSSGS
jgi:hypothetical protein